MGLETDSSEILNEMITSTINFGRVGVTGVYAGFTNQCVISPSFLSSIAASVPHMLRPASLPRQTWRLMASSRPGPEIAFADEEPCPSFFSASTSAR